MGTMALGMSMPRSRMIRVATLRSLSPALHVASQRTSSSSIQQRPVYIERNLTAGCRRRQSSALRAAAALPFFASNSNRFLCEVPRTSYFAPRRAISNGSSAVDVDPLDRTHFSDFFGEPVSFLVDQQSCSSTTASSSSPPPSPPPPSTDPAMAMAALDKHVVSVVSRGKSAEGGGDEEGIPTKSAHSYAISWAELLEQAILWNATPRSCGAGAQSGYQACAPMLVVAAVAPLLAQAGSAYLRNLDDVLARSCNADQVQIQLLPMANVAASRHEDSSEDLSPREALHVKALHHLLHDEHRIALGYYQKILQLCPGDALALSLALDVSSSLSDGKAALRAAASVASYWNERGRRGLPGVTNAVQPGHSIGTALIAVGYAAGGRYVEAERLAEEAMTRDDAGAGGVAAWALAATYDAEGRASEGTSMLSGYDGMQHFEKCGHLFFDSKLSGYGARFALDRDAAGAGRSAARIYGSAFERIIQYSGEHEVLSLARKAPRSTRTKMVESAEGAAKSVFSKLFGGDSYRDGRGRGNDSENNAPSRDASLQEVSETAGGSTRSAVDALCWLPPTPQVLTDATMLLLRLTLSGAVSESDYRWKDLKSAWERLLDLYPQVDDSSILEFCPISRVAASLVLETKDLCNGNVDPVFNKLAEAAYHMGRAMNLGGEKDPDSVSKDMWRHVTSCLAEARQGSSVDSAGESFDTLQGWDIDLRPLLDQGLCHAAVMSDDLESICLARAVCSEAVSLRPNSPESWWRYSVVLDRLGDENAAEDARNASVSLGAGEGGRM
eukprot:CAMPEP_0178616256 /NCGR_PEP_ID=MMETSP0698-20121128/3114_1 /TAXON_ID=265572 /ORGANISM="Extubocellulus spinifer, Strain CCMP396" /LENGTH=784 /DNA_ID=CAMNT_0020255073 /DNA_START=33 /DNA_END=2387 /DNA_ORIENTATION=+